MEIVTIRIKTPEKKREFTIQDALDKHQQGFDVTHNADSKEIIITKSQE